MFMLGLNESMDGLYMVISVCWHGHVLRRETVHVWRKALDVEAEGESKKGRPKRSLKKQVDEESMKVGLRREDALCRSKWSVGVNKIVALFEVNQATLTSWGYYQILNIGVSPSLILLELNLATLTCWGYYQITNIAVSLSLSLRRIWPPSLVGGTTRSQTLLCLSLSV